MKQKSELRNLQKFLKSNCISLEKFLIIYCNIECDSLLEIKLSHKDIKELIPNLKRVSFESLCSDIRTLYTGEVIAVKDSQGNVIPYVCPEQMEKSYPTIEDCKEKELDEIDDLIFNSDLNRYELSVICSKLKKYKKLKQYRIANKLLKLKKGKVKKSKMEKCKLNGEED